MPNISPTVAVNGSSKLRKEWPAKPRKDSARARAQEVAPCETLRGLKRRQSESRHAQADDAECEAPGPRRVFGKILPMIDRGLQASRRHSLPSAPSARSGFAQITLQHDCGAVVERMRQRRFAMNPFQSMIRERQRVKNGEPAANGCTAEPKSCRNPGSVSGKVRAAPPGSASASKTSTRSPACASTMAAASPLGPDPITHARLIAKCFTPRSRLRLLFPCSCS